MTTRKIYYTNDQLKSDLHEINRQMLLSDFKPDVIVGVARGGLIPATMLSHYHSKPLQVINYSLRDHKVGHSYPHSQEMDELIKQIKEGKNILVVDDICDSGETLAKVVSEIKASPELRDSFNISYEGWQERLKSAVLWNNVGQDIFDPDFVGREINREEDERWVIFPYEEWWKS